MTSASLADLDDLVLSCRSERARAYVMEAVHSYRTGAYRSCIVATWIAVVFDFIDKLRELDLSGDAGAKARLERLDHIRSSSDVAGSLKFEREMLDIAARDFELLSPLEHADLKRLLEDRNRCAHPSLNSSEEIYEPSAELARYHLRNAVNYCLRHPPVQGKAALDRLVREVQSELFPIAVDQAAEHFSHGPLARPRVSLVRNFGLILTKTLLLGDNDDSSERRYSAALNALRRRSRAAVDAMFAGKLPDIVRQLSDADLFRVIRFLAHVEDTWQYLAGDIQAKVEVYTERLPSDRELFFGIPLALAVPDLEAAARRRIAIASDQDLSLLIKVIPHVPLEDRAIELYLQSFSFDEANHLGDDLIIPLADRLDRAQIELLVEGMQLNFQIGGSFARPRVLAALRRTAKIPEEEFDELIGAAGQT